MRILLTGESTAGNLAPLIPDYEAILSKTVEENVHEKVEFKLISTESDMLRAFVQDKEIKFDLLNPGRENQKSNIFTTIRNFVRIMLSVYDYMPDVIFLKGGFVSLPVAITGWLFQIPIVMHESDMVPSDMDKFISRFVKRIAISFDYTRDYYPANKVFFSGNPVSPSIALTNYEESKRKLSIDGDKPVVFIMSGSTGARQINEVIVQVLPQLLEKYEIIHQCGIRDYEMIQSEIQRMNIPFIDDYHLFPFMKQSLADAYSVSDLVVARAGANTVAEIMLVGKPSILIPMADSESDNQNRNALFFSEAGAATLLSEKNVKPHLFLDAIDNIFKDRLKIMEMMRQARLLAHPEAADVVADEIIRMGK